MNPAGFFGKLPSHGDFVSRRISRDFLKVWDNWLQRAIAESKVTLGDNWLDVYLTSPIWRFAMMPGICGSEAYLGLVMPSIDRVGRYFPLTIAVPLPAGISVLGSAIAGVDWFDRSERLLLSVLDDSAPDLESFDREIEAGTEALRETGMLTLPIVEGENEESRRWQLTAAAGSSPGLAICCIAGGVILDEVGPLSFWWTRGDAVTGSKFLAVKGLPSANAYASMLSTSAEAIPENWQEGERDVRPPPAAVPPPTVLPPEIASSDPTLPPVVVDASLSLASLINAPVQLDFTSAARSVAGKVRRENEDAILDKPGESLWLVADGMGGHAAGKIASAAVLTAINELELPGDIDGREQSVTRTLQLVNRQLLSFAAHRRECAGLGSTVAVFFVADGTAGIVWAGDTRVYRLRGMQLEQLTVDHSEHQERLDRGDISSIFGGSTNVVTRAVGGDRILQVSTQRQVVHPGDRFLICSDGVYEELPVYQMAELLQDADCTIACDAIIEAVLEGRAQDNASAVVIDAASR